MYRASDRIAEGEAIARLTNVATTLELDYETISVAIELYLSSVPVEERSRDAVLAASCYTACLLCDDERSQTVVAEAFGVTRHVILRRWKNMVADLGLEPPRW